MTESGDREGCMAPFPHWGLGVSPNWELGGRTTGSCNGSYQYASRGVQPAAELCLPPGSGPCRGRSYLHRASWEGLERAC